MKIWLRLLLFWVFVLHGSSPVMSQDEDLFDLLDEVGAKEPTKRTIFGELRENAKFKLIGRTMTDYQKAEARPDIDNTVLVGEGRFEFKTGFTRGKHQFGSAGWLEYGSQQETYSQKDYYFGIDRAEPDIEQKRRLFELNELFWISSWGDLDVTFGKKQFRVGLTPLYSPSDRMSPIDLNDPLNIKPYGLWQLAADYYQERTTFSVALFPFFVPPKIPGTASKWRLTSTDETGTLIPNDFQFFDQGIDPNTDIGEDRPNAADELQVLARIKTTVKGWDIFLVGGTGVSPYPVLRAGDSAQGETSLVRQYIRATTASLGFSTTFGKFEVHGEGLFQWSEEGKDDDYFAAIGGVTYTADELAQNIGLKHIRLTVDYGAEVIIDHQAQANFVASSELVRIGQNDIFLLAAVDFREDLALELLGNFDFDDEGSMVSAKLRYRVWEGFWFEASSEFFQGPDESFYGRWGGNDRLIVSFDYSF